MKSFLKYMRPAALLLAVVAFAVPGCRLDVEEPLDAIGLHERQLTIRATYEDPMSSSTKTVLRMGDDNKQHVYWVPGDAISLFYGSGTAGGSKFTAQATSETRVTNFSGTIGVVTGGDEIGEDDTFFWGLYPYDETAECDGQTISVKIATVQEGAPDTFASGFAPSLGHDQGLMLAFRNIYCGLYFTVTKPGFRSMTLRANNGEVITGRAKIGIGSDNNPELREVLSGESYVTVTAPTSEGFEAGKKYYVLFFPRTLTGGFTAELYSTTQKGTFRVNSNVPFARNQISSIVNLDSKSQFEAIPAPVPEAVDLGLPSGLKWASFNVGATAPEEYGDYFAWGETEPKTMYSFGTYKWCNGTWDSLTKYNTNSDNGKVDDKTVLDPDDDVAHVKYGGDWRMPTDAEFDELYSNCTSEWTSQNGVNGYKFTSTVNGNSIFFPATGQWGESGLLYEGSQGDYWSSSLNLDDSRRACTRGFYSGGFQKYINFRFHGNSVRAVYEVKDYGPFNKYLTFTSEGTTTISLVNKEDNNPQLFYSSDATNWNVWDFSELTFTSDSPLYICGDNPNGFSWSDTKYSKFKSSGSYFGVSGDIMSLLDKEEDMTAFPSSSYYCFYGLFSGCENLKTAPDLPATTLAEGCYFQMFTKCTNLVAAPDLPATTLTSQCYRGMFALCTSLTTPPVISATTLAWDCCSVMFQDCTNLIEAPALLATELTDYCYQQMFSGCTSLVTPPDLPAETLTLHCYMYMFRGCTSLASAPALPATTLADYCYCGMFTGCTNLITAPSLPANAQAPYSCAYMFNECTGLAIAPELPATSLADYCYLGMFMQCSDLTTAPELPATTLTTGCYAGMFMGCSNLVTAPELPAATLAEDCYWEMFEFCENLTTAPTLPATSLSDQCYYAMFAGCTSLASAPSLPATTLAKGCYSAMFRDCVNLTTAPTLPATALARSCYEELFHGCTSLKYVKCLATDIGAARCLLNWMDGVSSTGTFVKAPGMEAWPSGISGIPEGWTVKDNITTGGNEGIGIEIWQ